MSQTRSCRRSGALLLAATALVGLAWILVLPPFEGFDETAHYSSIREIADTRTVPKYGLSRIATVVEAYGAHAPLPYMQQHGVTLERPMSYRDFVRDDATRGAFAQAFRSLPVTARRFEPGASLNWQAQHPPLYYLLLAPIMRATDGLSFVTQLMVLRTASWALAIAGLAIGVQGTARYLSRCRVAESTSSARSDMSGSLTAACLTFPFLVPMFFPEFARLGNDSLCLLIFGAAWALLLSMIDRAPSVSRAAALGACLGIGLLTKAFFVPIAAGALGCLAWHASRSRAAGWNRAHALRDVAIAAALAAAVGAWWYASALASHGALSGSHDVIALDREGGIAAGLNEHFAWRHVGRGIAAFLVTAYFAGTWTLARLPIWMYVPGAVALAALCVAALRAPRAQGVGRLMAVALWVVVPMIAGLGYYLLIRIAQGTEGHGAPGWYVSMLAPACAVPLGIGLLALMRSPHAAPAATAIWLWAVTFVLVAFWMHAALYAGVAVKDMETRHLSFPDGWTSLLHLGDIHGGLAVFGWPAASLTCLGAGTLLALMAISRLTRGSRNPDTPAGPSVGRAPGAA